MVPSIDKFRSKALRHSACLNLYHFIHPTTLTSSHQGTLSNYPPSHWKDMVFLDFQFSSYYYLILLLPDIIFVFNCLSQPYLNVK